MRSTSTLRGSYRIGRRLAVGLSALLTVLGCGSGSGSDLNPFILSLQSDAPCYGVSVRIDAGMFDGDIGSCEASDTASAAGCSTDFADEDGMLVANARGCMLDPGSAVFDCRLDSDQASSVEAATSVNCGCGCQDDCPATVSMTAQTVARRAAHTGVRAARRRAARNAGAVQTTTVSTTSFFCGTCCDYFVNTFVGMSAVEPVSELEFVLDLDAGDRCDFDPGDCELAVAHDGPSVVRRVGNTLEVCITDSAGIPPTSPLLTCELLAPSYAEPPLRVVRALGRDLDAIDPTPSLTVTEN